MRTLAWALTVWLCATVASAAHVELRLRIEWGGPPRQWTGAVTVTGGTLSSLAALGIEADEVGSMWIESSEVQIRGRSPRAYDGLDVTVAADASAELLIDLHAADSAPSEPIRIPLEHLIDQAHEVAIDETTRLVIRRAPGDTLRVEMDADSLVFWPNDLFHFRIVPHLLPFADGSRIAVATRMVPARGTRTLWSQSDEVTLTSDGPVPAVAVAIPLPRDEGVYDVVITAERSGLTNRLTLRPHVEERRIQLVVVARERPQPPQESSSDSMELLTEINPAEPAWWERMAHMAWLPGARRGPIGNGTAGIFEHPLGPMTQLGHGGRTHDIGWEAYPLPISRPGQPHIVEVDYPSNTPQTLGISIVEPNALGAVLPIGLDSGFHVPIEAADGEQRVETHRMVFWPRTSAPVLLLTNRRDGSRAVYGKIRLLGPKTRPLAPLTRGAMTAIRLPRAFPASAAAPERLLAGYYDRPLFVENFGASDAPNAATGQVLNDWVTFHEGAMRLVEYLNHVGYNGLVLSVAADASTIYPSRVIEPTPRYDDGIFFSSAQDPVRKDVLELLLRIFDREGLKLIPAIEFAAPLPALEAVARDRPADGIQLVDPAGRTWLSRNPPRNGLAPYYNALDPRIQAAMLSVVNEIAERYGRHSSFAGLAVKLSADGFTHVPGESWGVDPSTLARFASASAAGGATPSKVSPADVTTGAKREAWIAWRSAELARFYERMQAVAAGQRTDVPLYLTGVDLFSRPELRVPLEPALPKTASAIDLLESLALDPQQLSQTGKVVWVRTQRFAPLDDLAAQAANIELNLSTELDDAASHASRPASLFFSEPQQAGLASFDEKSPYRPTSMRLVTQFSPSAAENRRRFVHSVATLDSKAMFDGGWLLPLGQESHLKSVVEVYRSLPSATFETLPLATQPIVVRRHASQGRTTVYLANDSPWKATVVLNVSTAAASFTPLGDSSRSGAATNAFDGRRWTIELAPYDLAGGVFQTTAAVNITDANADFQEDISHRLALQIADLWSRAAALQKPPAYDVLMNPGFEAPSNPVLGVPAWSVAQEADATAAVDTDRPHSGAASLRLASTRGLAWVASDFFDPPASGRVTISVWLRVRDAARQPPLRLAVEGVIDGEPFYRFAKVGAGDGVRRVGTEWSEYLFEVRSLPPRGGSEIRLRLDMPGTGEVWIDDVELRDLGFSDGERLELSKLITLAEFKLNRGQIGDCLRLLDGYWPRFLETHVPLTSNPVARTVTPSPRAAQAAGAPRAEEKTGLLDRWRQLIPDFRR